MGIYIVAKFGTDWSIFRVLTKSNMTNFLIQGQIPTVLVRLIHYRTHLKSYDHIHFDKVWC